MSGIRARRRHVMVPAAILARSGKSGAAIFAVYRVIERIRNIYLEKTHRIRMAVARDIGPTEIVRVVRAFLVADLRSLRRI